MSKTSAAPEWVWHSYITSSASLFRLQVFLIDGVLKLRRCHKFWSLGEMCLKIKYK